MARTQAAKTAKKNTAPKKGGRKRKKDDKDPEAPQDTPNVEDEEDAGEVVIEEDPYATKEELEALEEHTGSEDLVKETVTGSREPAACLTLPLLPYQKEFLAWGLKQELSSIRGGVLADEMGMGKTLQAVSLIVTHPREGEILGPDSSPGAVAAAVEAPAPKMQLRLPSSLKRDEHAHGITAHSAGNTAPSADATDAEAETGAEQGKNCESGPEPASLQSPQAKRPDVDTKSASTPVKVGSKKNQPPKDADDRGKQEGSASPEGKSGKKGKAAPKEKKKKVDPLIAAMQQAKECYAEPEDNGTDDFCGATLVICPVVAALQWQQEIVRYTGAGTLNVVVYHGTKRNENFTQDQLEAADVVLTSYSTIEGDFRRNVMAPKATCKFCGKKFQPERLKVHLRYFCGPYAQKTEAQAKQQRKRAPWLVGGEGGGSGDGKKDSKSQAKTKGADGAGTSKGLKATEETEEVPEEDDDEAIDSGSESEEDAAHGKKAMNKTKKVAATKKAVSAKGKTTSKAKAASAKGSKKVATVYKSTRASKSSKGASTSKPQGKATRNRKAAAAAPPASKKRKLEDGSPDPPDSEGDGDEDDDMQPSDAGEEPAPVQNKRATSRKGPKAKKQEEVAAPGKVTRARASKATTPVVDYAEGDIEMSNNEMEGDDDQAPPKDEQVGVKRKQKPSTAGTSKKPAAKGGSIAKAAVGKKKKTVHTISDSDEDSDWDPDTDDEQQQQADAVESSDDESVVDEAADSKGEEDDVVEMEEEEDVLAEPETKKAAKERRDREEAELDRLVNEAASKMIAVAMKERASMPEGRSILHDVRWRRVILDEAHSIKDRRSNTAQAAFALIAKYRWCLTGTPLQNRVTELYSLIRFLRLHPFAHYFADKTKCCSLDFPFKNDVRKCDLCQGSRMSHYCWWNRRVANPIKYQGYEGRGRIAMLILKHQILPKVLLRRTKVQRSADLALPPRTVVLRKDPFDSQEADFYEALYTQSQAAFGGYVESGTILNNYAHIFDLLIRLRQAVNHPYLVVYSASGNKSAPAAALEVSNPENNVLVVPGESSKDKEPLLGICGICHDPLEDGIGADCGHAFCRICVSEYMASVEGAVTCPTCKRPLCIDLRAPATSRYNEPTGSPGKENVAASTSEASSTVMTKFKKQSILSRINISSFQSSTKLEALREEIHNMLHYDPSAKCIVFSQFTSMLDLVQYRLSQVGIRVVKLEGSMSMEARQRTIKQFNEDPNVPCFLMSLKAGGVALNLTVASHVMLMDPWWNPAVEQQAQDRIHRLGQFKPITVTRFVIAGTIEERILKLQDKKQLVFEGTVGRDSEALGKLTVDDLRFLFG